MFGFNIPLPVKALAFVLAMLGAMWFGYHKGTLVSEVAIAKYQVEAEKKQTELLKNNVRIVEKVRVEYVDRIKVIHDNQIVYRDVIKTLTPNMSLSNGWVVVHNAAAQGVQPDSTLINNDPSNVNDLDALTVVTDNYGTCQATRAQLIALQKWVIENKAATDAANKKGNK